MIEVIERLSKQSRIKEESKNALLLTIFILRDVNRRVVHIIKIVCARTLAVPLKIPFICCSKSVETTS